MTETQLRTELEAIQAAIAKKRRNPEASAEIDGLIVNSISLSALVREESRLKFLLSQELARKSGGSMLFGNTLNLV